MTREEALSKALSTRIHQLEGPQSTWEDRLNILLLVNKREDTLHVIFTAMEEYANQFNQPQPTAGGVNWTDADMKKAYNQGVLNEIDSSFKEFERDTDVQFLESYKRSVQPSNDGGVKEEEK